MTSPPDLLSPEPPRRKAAVFVDARNMVYAQKKAGYMFCPGRLQDFIRSNLNLEPTFLFWYTSLKEASQRQGFRDALIGLGYTVRSKLIREALDPASGRIHDKCSLEAEMVLDMINLNDSYDTVVVLSGDSNFACVLEFLRGRGKPSIIISSQGVASRELRNASDRYIELKDVRSQLEKLPASPLGPSDSSPQPPK